MNGDDFDANRLVGGWHARVGSLTCDWFLRGDGTCVSELYERGVLISRPMGRWTVEHGFLVSTIDDDEFGVLGSRVPDHDKLLEVTDDYFVISTSTGKRKYERLPHEDTPEA